MRSNKTHPTFFALVVMLVGLIGCEVAQAQLASPLLRLQQETKSEAPAAQSTDDITTLHVGTHLVILDVSVYGWDDSTVAGLKKEAFHLSEDGQEQTIRSFEEHVPTCPVATQGEAADLQANTFTNFKACPKATVNVIVLDNLTTPPAVQKQFRQILFDYMKTVPPGTPFIIFKLDTKLHMVQTLTTDPAALRAALEIKPDEAFAQPDAGFLEKRKIIGSAVDQLTRYLASTPGRKPLLWFSYLIGHDLCTPAAGFGVRFGQCESDAGTHSLLCSWTEQLAQNRVDTYRYDLANAAGPRVTSGLGCQVGRKVGNTIASVVDSAAHFYTLSYTPTNPNWDGRYRKVKIGVSGKGTLGDALEYRNGYYGRESDGSVRSPMSAQNATSGESPALEEAMGMGSPEPDGVVFQATVLPDAEILRDKQGAPGARGNFLSEALRNQGYRVYGINYAVSANQLGLIPTPDQTEFSERMDLVAVVYDSLGNMVNSAKTTVSAISYGPNDPRRQTATITANLMTQVPAKGDYFLRIGVRDATNDKVGALEIPIAQVQLPRQLPK
jgi:VWFA-related protein